MTVKRRAGETRTNPFLAGMPVAAATPSAVGPPVAVGAADDVAETDEKMSKYTALLDQETAAMFDQLALIARRKLGRKIDKSKLMRALIRLASDDASLRDQMLDEVGKRA